MNSTGSPVSPRHLLFENKKCRNSAEKGCNFFKKRCVQIFTGSGGPRVDPSESCTDDGHIRWLSL
jgi:hypothetical protein